MFNNQPVVSVLCNEPRGKVMRHVYPLELNAMNLHIFWEKAQRYRVLFSDEIRGDFKKFLEIFLSQDEDGQLRGHGLIWVVDDFVGVFFINDIRSTEATVHFSFFDGRFRGRMPLVRAVIRYGFEKYKFNRLNAELPKYVHERTVKFIEELGFIREGKKRRAVQYNGEMFDVVLYGLLREEAEQWEQTTKPLAVVQQQA